MSLRAVRRSHSYVLPLKWLGLLLCVAFGVLLILQGRIWAATGIVMCGCLLGPLNPEIKTTHAGDLWMRFWVGWHCFPSGSFRMFFDTDIEPGVKGIRYTIYGWPMVGFATMLISDYDDLVKWLRMNREAGVPIDSAIESIQVDSAQLSDGGEQKISSQERPVAAVLSYLFWALWPLASLWVLSFSLGSFPPLYFYPPIMLPGVLIFCGIVLAMYTPRLSIRSLEGVLTERRRIVLTVESAILAVSLMLGVALWWNGAMDGTPSHALYGTLISRTDEEARWRHSPRKVFFVPPGGVGPMTLNISLSTDTSLGARVQIVIGEGALGLRWVKNIQIDSRQNANSVE